MYQLIYATCATTYAHIERLNFVFISGASQRQRRIMIEDPVRGEFASKLNR